MEIELLALAALLAIGGLIGWAGPWASAEDMEGYEVILANDLEPFRSEFNANSNHVRLVLLVGPT